MSTTGEEREDMAHIRTASADDIPRILELYDELGIHYSQVEKNRIVTPEDIRNVFAEIDAGPGHEIFLVEDEGEVAGSIVLLIVPNLSHSATPWAIAENLIVGGKYRRRGYGKMLLEHVINRAREKGCHKVQLLSDRRRKEAHRLYHSVGFESSVHGFRMYF
jgi:GNAT superfamily N-acetyltransferase